jgi:hypothetical protein
MIYAERESLMLRSSETGEACPSGLCSWNDIFCLEMMFIGTETLWTQHLCANKRKGTSSPKGM